MCHRGRRALLLGLAITAGRLERRTPSRMVKTMPAREPLLAPRGQHLYIALRARGNPRAQKIGKTSMLNEVYNERILELAGNIPRLGRLPQADASATAHSKLCGSTVTVDLKMDGPVVTDFAHDVKACALGQASSSLMASHVVGSNADELRDLRETMRKMLKENGPPPSGKFAEFAVLEPVRDYKARHASTMLTFDAVVDAIGQIEARAKQTASA